MVMARLHIICGNCGDNVNLLYSVEEDIERDNPVVYIHCENCGTIHDLEQNARYEVEDE